jgi:hypothetical protein
MTVHKIIWSMSFEETNLDHDAKLILPPLYRELIE